MRLLTREIKGQHELGGTNVTFVHSETFWHKGLETDNLCTFLQIEEHIRKVHIQ